MAPILILGGNAYTMDGGALMSCPVHADLGEPTLTIADPHTPNEEAQEMWTEVSDFSDQQTKQAQTFLARLPLLERLATDDHFAADKGALIAALLHLKPTGDRYATAWGTKTAAGLARTVARIFTDPEK